MRALLVLALTLASLGAGSIASAQATSYAALVGRGVSASTSGDRGGALTAFREAVQAEPTRPEAICLLAAAQRTSGDLAAALESFRACAGVARGASDPRWTGRALAGVASTLEQMSGHLAEARTAWQEYVQFADGARAAASPEVGRARIQAIDVLTEQERVYEEVRARITEREAERRAAAAAPPPAAPARGGRHR